jgi:hypothetical protein
MEKRKLTKEDIDKVRDIDGFPIGSDEDIIALSDAPYYTACPNPFIEEFIHENGHSYDEGKDDYHREPFASDVSEGKTDPIYMAHAYHTKVPYKAIMKYILHYTDPGDVVFDGFCGTGMTGVAAQMCGEISDSEKYQVTSDMKEQVKFGARKAILNDIAPVATFLAKNFNSYVDRANFHKKLDTLIDQCQKELGWVYETEHTDGNPAFDLGIKGKINYTIWSDVLICPHCGKEFVFWNEAVDEEKGSVRKDFLCPNCGASLTKNDCERAIDAQYDSVTSEMTGMTKQVPVVINYTYNGKRYNKTPDSADLELIKKIQSMDIPYWYPTDLMMGIGEKWGDSWRAGYHQGMTRVHHFFTKRTLLVLSYLFEKIGNDKQLQFLFTSILLRASKLFKWSKNQAGPLSGTLYISSCIYETSVFSLIKNKEKLFDSWRAQDGLTCINTASLTEVSTVPDNSIDYIFTDPPFGDNLMYSELSFLWEAWLKVKTRNNDEAIMSPAQHKGIVEYQSLMTQCFEECYRVLKPGHWMTVEFHNSKNSVWAAIQESLNRSNFVVADVRTLDKKQGSFKQVNNVTAVKQDLVISVYKPKESFSHEFMLKAGSEEAVWDFVRQHLENLPIAPDGDHDGKIDIVSERQAFLLYDRMVSWHIMHGVAVPMSASGFYQGLDDHYLKRDGMYFLPEQVNEYDQKRAFMELENVQMAFAIQDEKGAIQWLNYQLTEPQTYQELQPKYLQELHQLRTEKMPELMDLLTENFLQDEDGKWYIPDIRKAGDVEKLRQKSLLKEFESYMGSKGKLKVFRSEAIRAGFSKLWKEKDYKNIVAIAERLPEATIQEDPNLLMYYDISLSRV